MLEIFEIFSKLVAPESISVEFEGLSVSRKAIRAAISY